ncbi:MAG: MFS transporter, partial [Chloroflexi bacterium]|nr:MFS transporter [Chloroflexota bacterium]
MTTPEPGTFAAGRNVRLLYAYSLCMQLQPHVAIWVVYLTGFRGLTLAQVGTLEAFFWTVSIVAEVPTGAFSDRFGRRVTFLVASVIEGLGILAFALASSFPLLLLSYALWSLGLAFGSGSASAFLYDSLAAVGRAAEYVRHQGRLSAIGRGGFLVGGIVGGLIAGATTMQLVILVGVVPYLAAIALALRMTDPPRAREEARADGSAATHSYRDTLATAVGVLRRDAAIRWIIVVTVSLDALLVADWLLMQPYLESHHIPVAWFGILAAPVRLAGIGSALLAHRYVALVGLRRGLGAMLLVITAGVAAIGVIDSRASFAGYFLLAGGLGLIDPSIMGYLNDRVSRSVRATVLSHDLTVVAVAFAIAGATA